MREITLTDSKQVGKKIKSIRLEMNITQDDLANFSGLSRIGIVKFEKDESDMKLSTLIKVANLLGYELLLKKRGLR
jgi:transcriptional regulator with XRE-family HTH domain